MKVLVTNANSRMALCLARELHKKGHAVVAADNVPHSLTFYSNKVAEHFLYPSPYSQSEAFIDCLLTKARELGIEAIIPVHEETFVISRERQRLTGKLLMAVPDYASLLKVHNKEILYENLKRLSITTPKTLALSQLEDLAQVQDEFSGPIVLKPRQGGGNFGIHVLSKSNDYRRAIEEYLAATQIDRSRVLVQEWVPSAEKFSHVVIYQNGRLVQEFADRHLRDFPLAGGAGVLRSSCETGAMTAISKKLFDAIQWHGIAEIEYVTHAETGEHYLIEINPRIWGGINSAVTSDLDIVGTLLDVAREADVEAGTYRKNTQTRWFWGDIRVLPAYLSASEHKLSVLREYISLLFNGTKTDEFYLDDPLPFFVWPCHAIYKMLKHRTLAPVSYDSLQGEWE